MGLFNKKQGMEFELPAKLEMLLNMAMENGDISDKELAVLRAEAQKHDISEGELDLIIKNRINKQTPKNPAKPAISSEEVNATITSNLYSDTDTVTQIFQKYENLCDCAGKKLEKNDREKLHRAQLTYVSSIASPTGKETMLELIAHTLPYTKKNYNHYTMILLIYLL